MHSLYIFHVYLILMKERQYILLRMQEYYLNVNCYIY